MTAPAWLARAHAYAFGRSIEASLGDAVACAARYDYAGARRATLVGARWGLAAVALGRLVQALGGPPGDAGGGGA